MNMTKKPLIAEFPVKLNPVFALSNQENPGMQCAGPGMLLFFVVCLKKGKYLVARGLARVVVKQALGSKGPVGRGRQIFFF